MDKNKKYEIPIGLKFPLQRGTHGYFDQNFTTVDQTVDNIKNLLLTSIGHRRLNIGFGSKLMSFFFEQISSEENFTDDLSSYIRDLILSHFPRIDILDLELNFSEENTNRLNIKLEIKLKSLSKYSLQTNDKKTLNLTMDILN